MVFCIDFLLFATIITTVSGSPDVIQLPVLKVRQ